MRAEIIRQREVIETWADIDRKSSARIEVLERALEPFARTARFAATHESRVVGHACFSFDCCDAALAALDARS